MENPGLLEKTTELCVVVFLSLYIFKYHALLFSTQWKKKRVFRLYAPGSVARVGKEKIKRIWKIKNTVAALAAGPKIKTIVLI